MHKTPALKSKINIYAIICDHSWQLLNFVLLDQVIGRTGGGRGGGGGGGGGEWLKSHRHQEEDTRNHTARSPEHQTAICEAYPPPLLLSSSVPGTLPPLPPLLLI